VGAGILSIVFGILSFSFIGFLSVLGFGLAISSFKQGRKPLTEEESKDPSLVLSKKNNKNISIVALVFSTIALAWFLLNRYGLLLIVS